MRRFVFRLEAVLRLRAFELARARARWLVLQTEWTRRETRVREAQAGIDHGERRMREEMGQGIDGRRLGLHAAGLASGRFELLRAEAHRDRLAPELETQRKQLDQARIRIRSLEKLRERRATAYEARARKLEQAELDELARTRVEQEKPPMRSARPPGRRPMGPRIRALGLMALLVLSPPVSRAAGSEPTSGGTRTKAPTSGRGAQVDSADPAGGSGVSALSRGVDSILSQVRQREVDLVLREQAVAERERAVVELEQRIDQRARELDRIRTEVEDRIHAWASQGGDRIAQLAKVYSEMPEDKAGSLLARLDLDLAVSIIRGMKKKASAGVLAAMGSDRALLVSERLLKPLDPTTDVPAALGP